MSNQNNHWVITVEEDPESGDLMLPLPQELLEAKGWLPGDIIKWRKLENGAWELSRKGKEDGN